MRSLVVIVLLALETVTSFAQFPTKGLIAYYPFNGNAKDITINRYDMASYKVAYDRDRFGNKNAAVFFFPDSIGVLYRSAFSLTDSFTLSFWMDDSIYFVQDAIVVYNGCSTANCHDSSNGVGIVYSYSTKSPTWGVFHLDHHNALPDTSYLIEGHWRHIVITYSNVNRFNLYMNDTLIQHDTDAMVAPTGFFTIGSSIKGLTGGYPEVNPYNSLYGKIDDLRIYNRELSPIEVDELYHEGGYGYPASIALSSGTDNRIKIYPIPAHDKFYISGLEKSTQIKLFNILGQQVYSEAADDNQKIINTQELTVGTYILQLTSPEGQRMSMNVVKQ